MSIITYSTSQTKEFAEKLAKNIKKEEPTIICLQGELGSGKTSFVQGFAKGLGIKDKITSPTFVIMKKFKTFYHIDCYRLNGPKDLLEIGFKDIISKKGNIICLEWPEVVKEIIPENSIWIKIKNIGKNKRRIIVLDRNRM